MEIAVSVKDSIDIKPGTAGSTHAFGVVVIFDGRQCGFQLPHAGTTIKLLRPDGTEIQATVGEQKEHGDGRSFFFGGMQRQDVPIGTILSWKQVRSSLKPYQPVPAA